MSRKNKYLDDLGIPRENYGGNFVHERKLLRFRQRRCYGFDYRDVFNMDSSFAEWLYSHMRMYRDNSVHDDTMNTVAFEGREYTIAEAVDLIIEKTGEFLKIYHYADVSFDYNQKNIVMKKLEKKLHPSVEAYLREYQNRWSDEDEWKATAELKKAGRLYLEIMTYCWM